MQTCKVLRVFILEPVASYQINRKSSLPFSGAIIPALKHLIPSELRSYACLGESSTRMGDLLGSPRVAPLLFAVRIEPHFTIHSFFLFLASNTLRARAAATGPSSERCHRRGPPLVAGRRGPVTLSRSLEIDFSSNCRENNHPRAHNCSTAEENNILIFFLPQRRKRAKC